MTLDAGWRPLKINIRNLIRDFLEMYPNEPEEVVLTESIANALDAHAKTILIDLLEEKKGNASVYSIADDGTGMTEAAFEDSYHAIALSTKEKGESIGFAGVGGKLYLAMLEAGHSIYTETRSNSFWGASELGMKGDEAVWRRIQPRGNLKTQTGTYVEVKLRPGKLDRFRVEQIIRESYNAILAGIYGGISIHVGWHQERLEPSSISIAQSRTFRVDRKQCKAYFWLAQNESDTPRGLDIVVLGKKVKGDQWFSLQFEVRPEFARRISGLIVADPLARFLTTNKQDLRAGNERTWQDFRGRAYATFKAWLRSVGAVQPLPRVREADIAVTQQVTRAVNQLLQLPGFAEYDPQTHGLAASGAEANAADDEGNKEEDRSAPATTADMMMDLPMTTKKRHHHRRRRSRQHPNNSSRDEKRGIGVRLVHRPHVDEEAWVESDMVVVNSGHPVFRTSQTSGRAVMMGHMIRCVFMALMENRDPSRKEILDELRKFYEGWATINHGGGGGQMVAPA